eukprot:COSAG01_NODE_53922_length_335_cov_5.521186_1_plen_59_part_10
MREWLGPPPAGGGRGDPTMPPPRLTYLQAFGDDETSVALAPTAGSHEHDGRRGGGDQRS